MPEPEMRLPMGLCVRTLACTPTCARIIFIFGAAFKDSRSSTRTNTAVRSHPISLLAFLTGSLPTFTPSQTQYLLRAHTEGMLDALATDRMKKGPRAKLCRQLLFKFTLTARCWMAASWPSGSAFRGHQSSAHTGPPVLKMTSCNSSASATAPGGDHARHLMLMNEVVIEMSDANPHRFQDWYRDCCLVISISSPGCGAVLLRHLSSILPGTARVSADPNSGSRVCCSAMLLGMSDSISLLGAASSELALRGSGLSS